jgi:hypothetical protein
MMKPDTNKHEGGETRREFLKKTTLAAGTLTGGSVLNFTSAAKAKQSNQPADQPWYRRTFRWGQTNITEKDPIRYDIKWWREYWKKTNTQGVIINAGGIVAYYPSKFPLHYQAEFLNGRDLYGELARAAHEDGLMVLARMDSNRAHEPFYKAHPDWFAIDAEGKPYRAGDLYISCINSPYYEEFLVGVLREIIERTKPEGITDNSWSGLGRSSICYCKYCEKKFRDRTGKEIPRKKDWNDTAYREWIQWNYERRIEIWDLNNKTTKEAGGPNCLWIGMNSGSVSGQSNSFRDNKEIFARAEIIMLDHQARSDSSGFQHNGEAGKMLHGLLGWDKLMPESMAQYQAGKPTFRVASKPEPEARMWMLDGFAGGIQPWWHFIGAYQEDRRMYHTVGPINQWHKANESYLVNRKPVATVGVVWSQRNNDFYGRDNAEELVELPFRGIANALIRARIPYLPVHIDHIDRDAPNLSLLILPNLAAMSDKQVESIRRFVGRGGGLIATGASSLFNEWGDARKDFALADLFGAHATGETIKLLDPSDSRSLSQSLHSYLRIIPELRGRAYGPIVGNEPPITSERHEVLQGFEGTDILPFGGVLEDLKTDANALVPLTFVPVFPVYPPETAWMREPKTSIPGLVINTSVKGGRVAYLPADLDRRFGRDNLPDHGNLLANLVRWAAKDSIPLTVKGSGLIDCHLYRQDDRLILHLVNLTSAGTWRAPVHELIAVGPLKVRIKLPSGVLGSDLKFLVGDKPKKFKTDKGWITFKVRSVLDHEVVVVG